MISDPKVINFEGWLARRPRAQQDDDQPPVFMLRTVSLRLSHVSVDELDLQQLGFEGVEPALTGRPIQYEAAAKLH